MGIYCDDDEFNIPESERTKMDPIFMPGNASEEELYSSIKCRPNGCVPVLTFIDKNSGNYIWRSSMLKSYHKDEEDLKKDYKILNELSGKEQTVVYSARCRNIDTQGH